MAKHLVPVSNELVTELNNTATEFCRTLEQEVEYRLHQALKLHIHLSDNLIGLMKMFDHFCENNLLEENTEPFYAVKTNAN